MEHQVTELLARVATRQESIHSRRRTRQKHSAGQRKHAGTAAKGAAIGAVRRRFDGKESALHTLMGRSAGNGMDEWFAEGPSTGQVQHTSGPRRNGSEHGDNTGPEICQLDQAIQSVSPPRTPTTHSDSGGEGSRAYGAPERAGGPKPLGSTYSRFISRRMRADEVDSTQQSLQQLESGTGPQNLPNSSVRGAAVSRDRSRESSEQPLAPTLASATASRSTRLPPQADGIQIVADMATTGRTPVSTLLRAAAAQEGAVAGASNGAALLGGRESFRVGDSKLMHDAPLSSTGTVANTHPLSPTRAPHGGLPPAPGTMRVSFLAGGLSRALTAASDPKGELIGHSRTATASVEGKTRGASFLAGVESSVLVPRGLRSALDATLRSLRNGNVDWVRSLQQPLNDQLEQLSADSIVPPPPDVSSTAALTGSMARGGPRFGDVVEAYTRRDQHIEARCKEWKEKLRQSMQSLSERVRERGDVLLGGYDQMEAAIEEAARGRMEGAKEACERATEGLRRDIHSLEVEKGKLLAEVEQEQRRLGDAKNKNVTEEAARREAMARRLEDEEARCSAEEQRIRAESKARLGRIQADCDEQERGMKSELADRLEGLREGYRQEVEHAREEASRQAQEAARLAANAKQRLDDEVAQHQRGVKDLRQELRSLRTRLESEQAHAQRLFDGYRNEVNKTLAEGRQLIADTRHAAKEDAMRVQAQSTAEAERARNETNSRLKQALQELQQQETDANLKLQETVAQREREAQESMDRIKAALQQAKADNAKEIENMRERSEEQRRELERQHKDMEDQLRQRLDGMRDRTSVDCANRRKESEAQAEQILSSAREEALRAQEAAIAQCKRLREQSEVEAASLVKDAQEEATRLLEHQKKLVHDAADRSTVHCDEMVETARQAAKEAVEEGATAKRGMLEAASDLANKTREEARAAASVILDDARARAADSDLAADARLKQAIQSSKDEIEAAQKRASEIVENAQERAASLLNSAATDAAERRDTMLRAAQADRERLASECNQCKENLNQLRQAVADATHELGAVKAETKRVSAQTERQVKQTIDAAQSDAKHRAEQILADASIKVFEEQSEAADRLRTSREELESLYSQQESAKQELEELKSAARAANVARETVGSLKEKVDALQATLAESSHKVKSLQQIRANDTARLTEELNDWKGRAQEKTALIDELRQTEARLKEDLTQTRQQLATAEKQMHEMLAQHQKVLAASATAAADATTSQEDSQRELSETRQRVMRLTEQHHDADLQVAQLQSQLKAQETRLQALQGEYAELAANSKRDRQRQQHALEQAQSQCSTLSEQLQERNGEHTSLQQNLQEITLERDRLKQSAERQQMRNQKLEEALHRMQEDSQLTMTEGAADKMKLQSTSAKCESLEQQLIEYTELVTQVRSELQQASSLQAETAAKLHNAELLAQNEAKQASTVRQDLTAENDSLRQKYSEVKKKVTTLTDRVKAAEAALAAAEDGATTDASQLRKELLQARGDAEGRKAREEALHRQLQDATQEAANARDTAAKARQDADAARRELRDQQATVDQATHDLDAARQAATRDADLAKAAIADASRRHAALEQRADAAEARQRALQEDLSAARLRAVDADTRAEAAAAALAQAQRDMQEAQDAAQTARKDAGDSAAQAEEATARADRHARTLEDAQQQERDARAELAAERERARQERDDIRTQRDTALERARTAEAALAAAEDGATTDASQLRKELLQARGDAEGRKAREEALHRQLHDATQEAANARDTAAKARQDADAARRELRDQQATVDQATHDLDAARQAATRDADLAKAAIADASRRHAALEQRADAAEARQRTIQNERDQAWVQVAALEKLPTVDKAKRAEMSRAVRFAPVLATVLSVSSSSVSESSSVVESKLRVQLRREQQRRGKLQRQLKDLTASLGQGQLSGGATRSRGDTATLQIDGQPGSQQQWQSSSGHVVRVGVAFVQSKGTHPNRSAGDLMQQAVQQMRMTRLQEAVNHLAGQVTKSREEKAKQVATSSELAAAESRIDELEGELQQVREQVLDMAKQRDLAIDTAAKTKQSTASNSPFRSHKFHDRLQAMRKKLMAAKGIAAAQQARSRKLQQEVERLTALASRTPRLSRSKRNAVSSSRKSVAAKIQPRSFAFSQQPHVDVAPTAAKRPSATKSSRDQDMKPYRLRVASLRRELEEQRRVSQQLRDELVERGLGLSSTSAKPAAHVQAELAESGTVAICRLDGVVGSIRLKGILPNLCTSSMDAVFVQPRSRSRPAMEGSSSGHKAVQRRIWAESHVVGATANVPSQAPQQNHDAWTKSHAIGLATHSPAEPSRRPWTTANAIGLAVSLPARESSLDREKSLSDMRVQSARLEAALQERSRSQEHVAELVRKALAEAGEGGAEELGIAHARATRAEHELEVAQLAHSEEAHQWAQKDAMLRAELERAKTAAGRAEAESSLHHSRVEELEVECASLQQALDQVRQGNSTRDDWDDAVGVEDGTETRSIPGSQGVSPPPGMPPLAGSRQGGPRQPPSHRTKHSAPLLQAPAGGREEDDFADLQVSDSIGWSGSVSGAASRRGVVDLGGTVPAAAVQRPTRNAPRAQGRYPRSQSSGTVGRIDWEPRRVDRRPVASAAHRHQSVGARVGQGSSGGRQPFEQARKPDASRSRAASVVSSASSTRRRRTPPRPPLSGGK